MEPTNDNVMLLRMVNAKINTWEARKKEGYNATGCLSDVFRKNKEIIYMSDYYETRRREFLVKVINSEPEDPIRKISMEDETLVLREYAGKKKWGGQRQNCWKYGIKHYWDNIVSKYIRMYRGIEFDPESVEQEIAIEKAVSQKWGVKRGNTI